MQGPELGEVEASVDLSSSFEEVVLLVFFFDGQVGCWRLLLRFAAVEGLLLFLFEKESRDDAVFGGEGDCSGSRHYPDQAIDHYYH